MARGKSRLTWLRGVTWAVVLAVYTCGAAQQPAAKPEFEVASVRPSGPLDMAKIQAMMAAGQLPRFGAHVDGLTAEYLRMTLKQLIARAYDVKDYQVTVPKDTSTEPFDIIARMPDGSTKDSEQKMLLNLLETRFKLQATKSTDETPVFALTVGKSGPKLKESATKLEPIDLTAELKPGEMKQEGPFGTTILKRNPDGTVVGNMGEKGIFTQRMDMQTRSVLINGTTTMPGLAELMTQFETTMLASKGGRPVVDGTELKGVYEVALELSLNSLMTPERGASGTEASDPGGGMGLDESLQKMGLKLEPSKAQVQHVTVSHVEKAPTEN